MTKLIWITDPKKRDAQVAAETPPKTEPIKMVGPSGRPVESVKLIKGADNYQYDSILKKLGEPQKVAKALISGDPELDLNNIGRVVDEGRRVWTKLDGAVLYAVRILRRTTATTGEEVEAVDWSDIEASVREDKILQYSGKVSDKTGADFTKHPFYDPNEVLHKYVMGRAMRLVHVNGLTFDYLFELASTLEKANKLMFIGAGPKGTDPLIFQTNGSPYRGFLEGRTKDGRTFSLILHLTNLELKSVILQAPDADQTK